MSAQKSISPIRVIHGALDETDGGEIVLRGVIDPASLPNLLTDDYQREVLRMKKLKSILNALQAGQVLPDIELGMRGENFTTEDGNVFVLLDPVYIVDGLQRVSATKHFLAHNAERTVRPGVTIHFSTTNEWERERFRLLNTQSNRMSPNILLRNASKDSRAIRMLHSTTTADRSFVLYDRVCWSQRMRKGSLLSALTLAKTVGVLHSHKAATRTVRGQDLVPALDKAAEIFSLDNMRGNLRTFFDVVDDCWGIERVKYREGAAYMKGSFLWVLAKLFSNHYDFWDQEHEERCLVIEPALRKKLALFPVGDPTVENLAAANGKARQMLYLMLVQHINSGKRTRRLRPRVAEDVALSDDLEEGMEESSGDDSVAA